MPLCAKFVRSITDVSYFTAANASCLTVKSSSFLDANLDTTKAALSATISRGGFADGDLITKWELGKCLGYSDRTFQRLGERYAILPPMALGGRKVWSIGKIQTWFADAAERREAEALKGRGVCGFLKAAVLRVAGCCQSILRGSH
jgi:hypothetical protein